MTFLACRFRPTLFSNITQRRLFASRTVVVERELPGPPPPSRKRWIWAGAGVGAVVWAVGLGAALNHQRLSSSVVQGTLFTVRYDPRVIELVGDKVNYADEWPWISGSVNHLKGQIDISFDVKGARGERAEVHFVSRRTGHEWKTIQFSVVRQSDKEAIDIGHQPLKVSGKEIVVEQ
ncbi:cytochrome oxidase complex assembly protein 1-domain-containing protein [Sporodiniella umbellata]|nr:cytochrome oxidase complex assembly protein 1-domain-containing protein [Sporodiniella umbellata]